MLFWYLKTQQVYFFVKRFLKDSENHSVGKKRREFFLFWRGGGGFFLVSDEFLFLT